MQPLLSSQDFIRSLRAQSDPPVVGGPWKIEIVQGAWNNNAFYVPNKAEVIADWILTKMLKEKAREIPTNAIFDIRYWQLLLSLIGHQDTSKKNQISSKPWLTQVLNRIQLAPILAAFLASYNNAILSEKVQLTSLVSTCLSVMWPISVQRMNAEILQECFGSLLSPLSSCKANEGISTIGVMVSMSYLNLLINSSSKKKLYQSFLNSHLKIWLQSLSTNSPPLRNFLFDAGAETLFNLDVLRQNQELKPEVSLVKSLQEISVGDVNLVLEIVPEISASYIQALRKHRGALFGQSSQSQQRAPLDELRESGITFAILILGLIDHSNQNLQAWKTRLSLLQMIKKENIFAAKQDGSRIYINTTLNLIIAALKDSWKDHREFTDLVVQCLLTILQIDCDLVLPFVSQILPLFLQTPTPISSHFAFLAELIEYHIKTRTLGSLVNDLFMSVPESKVFPNSPREQYQLFCSSPIMHPSHFDRLSKALGNFLTESQCLNAVNYIVNELRDKWKSLSKNIKTMEEMGEDAVVYCILTQFSALVLTSLPVPSLPSVTLGDVQRLLIEFREDFVQDCVSTCVKKIKKASDLDTWSLEIISTSTLRLLYALNVALPLSLPTWFGEKLHKRLSDLILNGDILPEMTLEMHRLLFYDMTCKVSDVDEATIGHLFSYLQTNFLSSGGNWSGQNCKLVEGESGKHQCAIALMYMVIEKWLPLIDELATPYQLRIFLNIVVSIPLLPSVESKDGIQPEHLLLELFHSAQFWELHKIRSVFLAIIEESTSLLDSVDSAKVELSFVLKHALFYSYLLFFPLEYFPPKLLNDLMKRCMAADLALDIPQTQNNPAVLETLVILRIFLQRSYSQLHSTGQDSGNESSRFLVHLLAEKAGSSAPEDLKTITLDLIKLYFIKFFKASKSSVDPILEALQSLKLQLLDIPLKKYSLTFTVLVSLLEADFAKSSLPHVVTVVFEDISHELPALLLPRITSALINDFSQASFKEYSDLVQMWSSVLRLQHWLASSEKPNLVGERLISTLIRRFKSDDHKEGDELAISSFGVLVEELNLQPASEHPHQLDVIFAAYLTFWASLKRENIKNLDLKLGKACKKMSVEDYVELLKLASDSLTYLDEQGSSHLSHLVHLSSVLVRERPAYSLVHSQKFVTSSITLFAGNNTFVQEKVNLRLEVLDMILQYCADSHSALRSIDVFEIWLLLFKFLAPSVEHDERTEPAIFHRIVAIVSSLVRLRRDLVSEGLCHFGMILQRLVLSTRRCRPNLGAKQTSLVAKTLPRWINTSHPLRVDEAKVLGRLLESLNTKTTVRLQSSTNHEPQKAESLAKPFSKHAAYVLKAYIDSMNDPLCTLPIEVRRELQPGIFTLCSMVSEHSRDSLMVSSLNSGGKATLKLLWKEYEKQRYIGKG